jgi:hypothetical protein
MNIRVLAHEIHGQFAQLVGSQYIASEHAIRGLLKHLVRRQPQAVLEVGSGIGTLTLAVIRTLFDGQGQSGMAPPTLTCLEDNEFCRRELLKNLKDHRDRFMLFQEVSALPGDVGPFDFIIIDGPIRATDYASKLARRAVIFVENNRADQRVDLETTISDRRWVYAYFNRLGCNELSKGGYWIYQFEPHLVDRLHFASVNVHRRLLNGGYWLLHRSLGVFRRGVRLLLRAQAGQG